MKKIMITFGISTLVLMSLFTSCSKSEKQYKGVPSQIISVNQAVTMKKEYSNTIAPLIEESKSTPQETYNATEYAYIELDTLKKYIAFLENVQKKNEKQKITGLRFYFAAYPKVETNTNVNIEESGRETFFIAPTTIFNQKNLTEFQLEKSYLKNVPFSIVPDSPKDKYVGKFKVIDALLYNHDVGFVTPQMASSMKIASVEETSLIMNDLYVCPPPKK